MKCDRCGKDTMSFTSSMFNTETICMDCEKREKEHPLYEKARRREAEEVRKGNFNFQGIGLPPELMQK